LIDAIVALSDFVLANDEAIEAIDINPLIAHAGGVVGVDALILTRSPG
jgi:hypothetical protein